jgi:hypothetical protein
VNRNDLIDRCKAIIVEAYEEATEMIVAYLELNSSEPTQTLCKEIDPDGWQALDSKVRRRQAARKASTGAETSPSRTEPEWKKTAKRHARTVARNEPETLVEQLNPAEQRRLAQALDTESAKRQREREQDAKQKEREHLGEEVVDDLALREELQSTEYLLIKARGNIRGFVEHTREIGVESTPEAWRESCLDWLTDLDGHVGMAKALLAGDNVDWAAFESLLERS